MGFVDVYKRGDVVDVRGRGFLVRMFAIIQVSFLPLAHPCLSGLVLFQAWYVVKRIAATIKLSVTKVFYLETCLTY